MGAEHDKVKKPGKGQSGEEKSGSAF